MSSSTRARASSSCARPECGSPPPLSMRTADAEGSGPNQRCYRRLGISPPACSETGAKKTKGTRSGWHWQFNDLRHAHWTTMMIIATLGGLPDD